MHAVGLLLAAAAAGHVASRALRLPVLPFLLVAGLGLARLAPLPPDLLRDTLVLGVSFLLFVMGLELEPSRMRGQRGPALRIGAVQFLVLAGAGYVLAAVLGFPPLDRAYLALALTTSSTLVGIRILQRRQEMFDPWGRLVLGVLLVQDLLVLLAIPVITGLAGQAGVAARGLFGVAVLGGLSLVTRRWLAPLLLRTTEDREILLLSALSLLFLFVWLAGLLGLPGVVGAFLAGLALARFPVNGIVRIELAPLGDFFAALFFTALGALIRVPTSSQLFQAVLLGALVVLVTVPLVGWMAERSGFSAKSSVDAGLLLSQTSEISLVIGLAGLLQGHLSQATFTVIAAVTVGTMMLTPLLATDRTAWRLLHLHPSRRRREEGEPPRDHVLLLGAGSTGMPLIEDLLVQGARLVVVDEDPAVLARLDDAGIPTVRGEASDPEVLRRAGAHRARVVCSTIHRPADNDPVLAVAPEGSVVVRVFDEADADRIRRRGGTPVLYSAAAADAFMEWLHGFENTPRRTRA